METSTVAESRLVRQIRRAIAEETATRSPRDPPRPGPSAVRRLTSQQTRYSATPAAEGRPARSPATPPSEEKQARPPATLPSESEQARSPGAPPAEGKLYGTSQRDTTPPPYRLNEHHRERIDDGAPRIRIPHDHKEAFE